MDIKVGEIRNLPVRNLSFWGFLANIVCNGTNPEAGIDKTSVDFTKMICRGKLTRDGKTVNLFNQTLAEMVALSHYFSDRYAQMFNGAASFGIIGAGRSIFPVRFGLGQMNLKNSDQFDLEVELQAGFFKAGISEANSYVRVDAFKTIGIEYSTPVIECVTMDANVEQYKKSLGNGISKILFYVKDSTAIPADGAQIISSVQLSSDKIELNDKFVDVYNRRIDQFQTVVDAEYRGENSMIHAGQILNNVEVEFSFIPGKVAASVCKLIVVRENTDAKQMSRADATAQVHAYENAVSAGVRLSASQVADYRKADAIKKANLQA